jgi:hypothetical protein
MDNPLPAAPIDPRFAETWHELGQGTPTIAGLAWACSISLATGGDKQIVLSPEAKAILYAARNRGLLEIKASNRAFESPARMLAVYVETDAEHAILFRVKDNPACTIRFLAGFRELCAAGLVMHQIYQEFSLTRAGLEMAQTVPEAAVEKLLELGSRVGIYE